MTMNELKQTIEKLDVEIKQLEEDLLSVKHEHSRSILQREINISKHTKKQYLSMLK